ncbi:pyridoxal phosphate-dependent aminotransferase [Pseudaestuariivita sp.]|uniref:pyridoxal phosphate-dependent aminotransferase n=1 Tax=Pseudaestuariivita sp. TaxID=2211669 RepID=UPI0040586666
MTHPRYTELAQSLPASVPFVGPEAQERAQGRRFDARLGANESVFGPSPRAIAAMQAAAAEAWMYGDPTNFDLKEALAAHHGITPDALTVGEGIDGLLGVLVRLLIAPGDTVVTSDGAYPTFNYHVAGFGGQLVKVPYRDDHEDPDALVAAAIEHKAKLVYLANPDNPMGTWLPAKRITAMLAALPEGCLLCLDEAYADFAPTQAIPPLDTTDPRLVRMRTFSKAYGMAGARVGYAIGAPELVQSFDKVRNHFGVNRIAQAGALAALGDQGWMDKVRADVATARDEIGAIAARHGLRALPSATNFVAVDCGAEGDFARKVLAGLVSRGVFARMPFVAPQDRCIRVSAGRPEDLAHFKAALGPALADARST